MTTFQSWRRDLDALRRAAIEQTEEDPRPTAEAIALAREGLQAMQTSTDRGVWVRAAARGLPALGLEDPSARTIYGWHVLLSRTRYPDGSYNWHLSASLSPRGRSSTERDWQMLGRIAAHLGAPRDPSIVPEDPNGVHHWQWFETT